MAWTGNFKDQIDDLAGVLATTDDAAIQQWILDGCYDVITKALRLLGEDEVWKFAVKSSNQTSNNIDVDEVRTIAAVVRNDIFATKGKWQLKDKYADANSLYGATANHPIWYLDNSEIMVFPAPTGGAPANYYSIPEYAITNWNSSTSSINNYPSEYYYHVMLYASIQVVGRRMVDYTTPTTLSSLSITAVTPDEIPAPAISSPGVSTIPKPDISGDVPSYSSITVASGTLGALVTEAISDLSITAVSPDAPSIATINYTPPAAITVTETGDLSDSTVADITVADIVAVTSASLSSITAASSSQPSYLAPALPDRPSFETSVTDEDQEVLQMKVQQYQTDLSSFQNEMSDSVNEFNENNTIYSQLVQQGVQNANAANQNALQVMQKDLTISQANNQKLINITQANMQKDLTFAQANHQEEIQRNVTNAANAQAKAMQDAIQQVQDTVANNGSLISEYQANLAVYQAEVGTEVQEFSNNLSKTVQLWQQTNTTRLQEHSQRMQDALNTFNKDNARYQANVQAEMTKHSSDVAEVMKEADLTLQANIQDYTFELQKWQQSLSVYQAEVNTQVSEYTNNLQKFSADMQANTTSYTWLESQYAKLKSEYEGLFSSFEPKAPPAIQSGYGA